MLNFSDCVNVAQNSNLVKTFCLIMPLRENRMALLCFFMTRRLAEIQTFEFSSHSRADFWTGQSPRYYLDLVLAHSLQQQQDIVIFSSINVDDQMTSVHCY